MNLLKKTKRDDGKKGILFLAIGSVLAFIVTILFALGVTSLTGVLTEARHGSEAAYTLSALTLPCIFVAMLLAYGILAVWYIAPSEKEIAARNRGLAPMLGQPEAKAMPKSTLWIITGLLILGIFITGAVCLGTYKLVTENGVANYVCFIKTEEYGWDQVNAYTIDCDTDKGLTITFTMRDGKKYEILDGVCSTTEAFDEKYTSTIHFAAETDDIMNEQGVPRTLRNRDRAANFYKNDPGRKAHWVYVSKIIEYEDLDLNDDETVPETDAPTEPATDLPTEAPTA